MSVRPFYLKGFWYDVGTAEAYEKQDDDTVGDAPGIPGLANPARSFSSLGLDYGGFGRSSREAPRQQEIGNRP